MRRLAHRRLAALRDAPLLFGAGAVALLVDALLLALWLGTGAGRFGPFLSFLRIRYLDAQLRASPARAGPIVTIAAMVLFSSAAILAVAALRTAPRRAGSRSARVGFFVTALTAALLAGAGGLALTAPGEADFLAPAVAAADAGYDAALLDLIGLQYPSAVSAGRDRLKSSDPSVRFLYGAALEAAGHGDKRSRRALREAVVRIRVAIDSDPALLDDTAFMPWRLLAGWDLLNPGSGLYGPLVDDRNALDPADGWFWAWWEKAEPDYRAD